MQAWPKLYLLQEKAAGKSPRQGQSLNPPNYCLLINTIPMSVQPCAELLQHKATEILLKEIKTTRKISFALVANAKQP